MKNIYVNGCSHTAGTRLSLPDKSQSYAHLLAKHYDANIINRARPGDSNEKIFRQTISDICQMTEKPDLVILQWTEKDRFETPSGPNPLGFHNTYSRDGWLQHRPRSSLWGSRSNLDRPYRKFYKGCHSCDSQKEWEQFDVRLHKKLMSQIIAADSFLKVLGIKTIHMSFFRFILQDSTRKAVEDQCEFFIDPGLGMNQALINSGFEVCTLRRDDSTGEVREAKSGEGYDGHFKEDAHLHLFEWLLEYIEGDRKMITMDDLEDKSILEREVQNVYDWE